MGSRGFRVIHNRQRLFFRQRRSTYNHLSGLGDYYLTTGVGVLGWRFVYKVSRPWTCSAIR
jgi:hypothetical protein